MVPQPPIQPQRVCLCVSLATLSISTVAETHCCTSLPHQAGASESSDDDFEADASDSDVEMEEQPKKKKAAGGAAGAAAKKSGGAAAAAKPPAAAKASPAAKGKGRGKRPLAEMEFVPHANTAAKSGGGDSAAKKPRGLPASMVGAGPVGWVCLMNG